MLCCVCELSRPSQIRRSAFTRSPQRKTSSSELSRMHTPSENFHKTSAASDSGSPPSSAKKRSSVDKTTPRSSRTKISTVGSVTGTSADRSSAKTSAAKPQVSSRGEESSANNKQKIAAGQSHGGRVSDPSPSSSRTASDSSTKMMQSGRLGADKATRSKIAEDGTVHSNLKMAETERELKGKGSKQQSSTKVISARQKGSEKQPTSARDDSRPASGLSVYVSYISTDC